MNLNTPAAALAGLERQVAHDLARLNYPASNWVIPRSGPDGKPMLDVLIVGGGMCGQTAAFALMRQGVRNIRIVDRVAAGFEGPWGSYARMQILRSPKHLTGPDLGVASLSYRAWHETVYGLAAWEALHKIDRLDWLRYLVWVRQQVAVPIESRTEMTKIIATEDRLHVDMCRHVDGAGYSVAMERVYARKVVLALGRDGSGDLRWPLLPSFQPEERFRHHNVFHSADDIDFRRLQGKRVAVLGAGASAFDNAATALEAGAAQVTQFVRREFLPQVNKSKWTAFPGFMLGFSSLSDEQRWRFFSYIHDEQVPPPWESVQRCDRHPNFALRLGCPWLDLVSEPQRVQVHLQGSSEFFDAAILATGFDVNLLARDELKAVREHVLIWGDRIDEEEAAEHPDLARFPYLGSGFELLSVSADAPQAIGDIHLFNHGSTLSHGALAGDIPGLATGAHRLARRIVRDLFGADAEGHYERLHAYEEPELENTRYFVPPARRGPGGG